MTNRQRLLRAIHDLSQIKRDYSVGPEAYERLATAQREIMIASRFALDYEERNDPTPIAGFQT